MALDIQIAPLDIAVTTLKGVGAKITEHLHRLNIINVQDLLFHLPLRYEDRTQIKPIGSLKPQDRVLIEGSVESVSIVGGRRANLVCRLSDGTGFINLRFFHFNAAQKNRLSNEQVKLRCFGEVRQGFHGGLEMMHPEYRHMANADELPLSRHLTPVYPTTKGLNQATFRKLIDQACIIMQAENQSIELLPDDVLKQLQLPTLQEALLYVHRPPANAPCILLQTGRHPAQQRLAFEELLAHQLSLKQLRKVIHEHPAHTLSNTQQLKKRFLQSLPFQLTSAQRRVVFEIQQDLEKSQPMLRLVQGDVGCGKTVVAAIAMLQAVDQGFQAALMAPTEILAEQHYKNFCRWFNPLGIEVGWLSGKQTGQHRTKTLQQIANGGFPVIVGTHALFQASVEFDSLALLVVDEQHRFGVHQRLALKEKGMSNGRYPHQLIMTATPIPRTLAMLAYADLDCSVIDEQPPGRKPINTVLIPNVRRDEVVERVRLNCMKNQQAFWVCTLIDDSELMQCQAAQATTVELQKNLSELKIGLIHGRMKSDEKEQAMSAFKSGEINLLVATTVVEVGVDIPQANLMIIENPERLGLAQLHQLRGRVGRSHQQGHCVLLYQNPLSESQQKRLSIMRRLQCGFEIARYDLKMRGPGEVLGTRQAGLVQFRIADLMRDQALLENVQMISDGFAKKYPEEVNLLIKRWISGAEHYARV